MIDPKVLAIAGTGNFATNLTALCSNFGMETVFFVDEFRQNVFLGKPVLSAGTLDASTIQGIGKWLIAISHPDHQQAAVARLLAQGVAADRILPIDDDPALQILRLLFEVHGEAAVNQFCAPGLVTVGHLEQVYLQPGWEKSLHSLDPDQRTIGLGYFGRGGGFRRHISSLIPMLEENFNVVTMSDEVMDGVDESSRHLYLSADSACTLDCLDLVLSAHVFPCARPEVPRVSFSHVIYDFNLTAEYHASRLALSDTHYLFASSRPCFDWYVELVKRFELKNRICVIPGGYLQLDRNLAALGEQSGPQKAIIYAPTLSLADYPHCDLVTSIQQGADILKNLLEAFPDRRIIFRPHPSDLRLYELDRHDPRCAMFGRMLEICHQDARCTLDDNATSYLESYGQSALMVSDSSSTAFTFAFATGRPVIFFSPRDQELVSALGQELQFVGDRSKVGRVVQSLKELVPAVEHLLQIAEQENSALGLFRERMIFNIGSSAEYFVENIEFMLNGERHPHWHYINW